MTGPRVSSAILKPRQWFPGTPKNGYLPPSIQVGSCSSVKRRLPAGVPKKKTSCRVGMMVGAKNGKTFPDPGTGRKNKSAGFLDLILLETVPFHRIAAIEPGLACACRYLPP